LTFDSKVIFLSQQTKLDFRNLQNIHSGLKATSKPPDAVHLFLSIHALLLIRKQRTKLEERISTWEILLEDHATLPWPEEGGFEHNRIFIFRIPLSLFCLFSNIKLIVRNTPFYIYLVPLLLVQKLSC